MRKRTVRILTVPAVVVVMLGVIYAVMVSSSAAKLRRAYAALKGDGRPMDPHYVIPPDVDDVNNAALLYESAALLLKAQPGPEPNNLPKHLGELCRTFIKETLDPEKRAELEKLIQQDAVTTALSIVEQGTQRPACRFDLDYDAGPAMLMPHLAQFRQIIRILGAKVLLEAEAGDPNTAWQLAQTQLRFADALRQEPVIVSQLVRTACIAYTCTAMRRLCEIAPPNEQQRREIESLLRDYDDIAPLVRAMDAERLLIGEWIFNLPRHKLREEMLGSGLLSESYAPDLFRRLRFIRASFKPTFLADHAMYLQLMHGYTRIVEGPYTPDEDKAVDREFYKSQKRHLLTSYLIPAATRVKEIHCRLVADIRMTRAGLSLLQHKRAHGAFPKTLDALGLQEIDDPFTDGPIRYRAEDQGFVLYSVGPDQTDNNGSPKQKRQETDYDCVWRFPSQQTQ